jgi:hypothetical protein
MSDQTSEPRTYEGGCHCGKVRFRADLDLSKPVIACNCSMCGRSGTLLSFVPSSSFVLLAGDDALTDYQFGKKHIHHRFCSTCGIKCFGDGVDPKTNGRMYAVNTRCLDEVDPVALPVHRFDGKSL